MVRHDGDDDESSDGDAKQVRKILCSPIQGDDNGKPPKSLLSATLETLGKRGGGTDQKGDTVCEELEEAMLNLQSLVMIRRQQQTTNGAWDFSLTPLKDFDATEQNLLQSFVLWSKKCHKGKETYNVSKAFRRLEAYVDWMDQNTRGLDFQQNNGITTMEEAARGWNAGMKMSHDEDGRLVWFCDLEALDLKFIKHHVPHHDTFRYLMWLAHLILFDQGTQENGVVLVYAIGRSIGFVETMTVVPFEMQTKFDNLTIGRLPIRVESIITYNNPTWMRVLVAFARPFLSRKMTRRLRLLSSKDDPRQVIQEALGGGSSCIPAKIMPQLKGTLEKDLIEERIEILEARSTQ